MPNKVPPVPNKGPMIGGGNIGTAIWLDWFKQLLQRVGGNTVTYNLDELWTFIQDRIEKPGVIKSFGGASSPAGYLLCDGAARSRTTYSDLFAAVGVIWGPGDGSTTFNVPNLGGKFLVGKDSGTFTPLGSTGGAESTTLPNHTHPYSSTTGTPSSTTSVQSATTSPVSVASSTHTHPDSGTTGNPGSNPTIPTLPPYAVINWIIKT